MDMGINQPRHQELAGAVDHAGASRRLNGRPDRCNAIPFDHNRRAGHRRPAGAVNERDSSDRDDAAALRERECRCPRNDRRRKQDASGQGRLLEVQNRYRIDS
jgi:hypothetical protein